MAYIQERAGPTGIGSTPGYRFDPYTQSYIPDAPNEVPSQTGPVHGDTSSHLSGPPQMVAPAPFTPGPGAWQPPSAGPAPPPPSTPGDGGGLTGNPYSATASAMSGLQSALEGPGPGWAGDNAHGVGQQGLGARTPPQAMSALTSVMRKFGKAY